MPLTPTLIREDGSRYVPPPGELSVVDDQYRVLTQAIGMPRIDEKTLPEFERRVRLFEELIQTLYVMDGKPAPLPVRLPEGCVAMVTNASRISKREFDKWMREKRQKNEARR